MVDNLGLGAPTCSSRIELESSFLFRSFLFRDFGLLEESWQTLTLEQSRSPVTLLCSRRA